MAHGQDGLRAFVAVAEQASFSRAAERLGVSPSALSQRIRHLEARLGIGLFHRTTRSVALTEAGERLYVRVRTALSDLDAAVADAVLFRERPAGIVRLRSSRIAFRTYIERRVAAFHAAAPDVVLDVTIDDSVADIVAGGFDVGFTIGEVLDDDMMAVRIGPDLRHVAVAAPDYLARRGIPAAPRDLRGHACLRWRWPGRSTPYVWEFVDSEGAWFDVAVDGPLVVTDHGLLLQAALDGVGIAFCPDVLVAEPIAAGSLVPILENWSGRFPGYCLCFPRQRRMAPALRAFIDFMKGAGS